MLKWINIECVVQVVCFIQSCVASLSVNGASCSVSLVAKILNS